MASSGLHESLRQYGASAVSFVALESGLRVWFDAPRVDGAPLCVAYAETGSAWIAAGDPLAPRDYLARTAARFVAAARARGKRACFFASEYLEDAEFDRVLLGEQPIYRAADWRASIARRWSLREQLCDARAKGVHVRRVEPDSLGRDATLRREVLELAEAGCASTRMPPLRFLLAIEPFEQPEEHRYFVAEKNGCPLAFLSAVPIYRRGGWLIEDVITSADAPNGTTESLLHALLVDCDDAAVVTFGLSPLTGRVPLWLRAVRAMAHPLYSFAGLRQFRERLRPVSWEPVWLVVPRGEPATLHMIECLRAFAGGSLSAFAARAIVAHPSGAPFVVATCLVPWTLLLAVLVATDHARLLGFSAHTLFGWVLFDAILVVFLLAAAARPQTWSLTLAASVVSLGASISLVHLAEVGTGPTLLDGALRVTSAVGPLVAAAALAWALVRTLPRAGHDHRRTR